MSPTPASAHTLESACHRALRCAELLDQILQEIVSWDVALRRRSFRNIALTCRAFLHPATASLWSDLPGLWRLYRVLVDVPKGSLSTSSSIWGQYVVKPFSIQEADVPGTNSETWGRFLQYAAFVRGVRLLVLKTSHEDPARDLFTLLLKRRHGHSFLPELRELNLNVIGGLESAHVFILSSLASPTVTALGIHSSFGCEEESRHLLHGGLAETVTKAFPGIFSLQISLLGEAIEDPSRMVADLVPLKHLRHLTLNWHYASHGGPSYLQALLFTLPQLEHLDAYFSRSATTPLPAPQRVVAPRLRHLACCGDWGVVSDLPSTIWCPSLEELRIALQPAGGLVSHVNCDLLCACVQAISDPHFAPYLRKLSIHAPVDRQYAVNLLPPPQRRTLADILHPLSALKHLEDVSFTMDFYRRFRCLTPNISDDDIRAVAAALRRVRRIELLLKNPVSLQSPPTLRSLVHFATLCPQLVSLSLSQVDIDSATRSTSPSDGPVRCDTLRILRLVNPSPATEPRRIAAYLHPLFPHLDVAGCAFADDTGQSAVVQDEMRLLQQVSENHN